ncbi:hypothetical protein BvCmsKKNP019_04061 [Escherichia coli]|uniref:hypothetical protein n=1 Tax=Escherichia coli TaxID=562 RepID=UPI0010CB1520|nr:hypothetical protein [Escherichia coli]EIX4507353.1 hypothetical protein [Escherichia coli]GDH12008.1 hypothetical protein BvCmsKKNP019_04061 [Escherichia coli]HAX4891061.1 hypothetical protein [Escherichia coli]
MATFGAYLRLSNGNIFVTPDSTPMCLYSRVALNSSQQQTIAVPNGKPVMVFIKNTDDTATGVAYRNSSSTIVIPPGNGYAYIFSIFPQSRPKWGMAIWNASGELVLTNESRILTDIVTVGTAGSSGGIYIDQTLPGSYAVVPQILGAAVGMGSATIYTESYYNGSNTRIRGKMVGSLQQIYGYINHGNAITAIKTDAYD